MNILFISSEVYPYAKTGGLADAVPSLARALSARHSVKIILPRYYVVDREKLSFYKAGICIHIGQAEFWVSFYKTLLPDSQIEVYFVDYERLYGRAGLYSDSQNQDFPDNPLRFSLLSYAAFALCKELNWTPDILHCNDWQASLAPILLKYIYAPYDNFFKKTKSVLTIHNIGYQGQYSHEAYNTLGLPWELYYPSGIESNGGINFLKGGLTSADYITTVSPTYAREIQTPSLGYGLDGLLRVRQDRLKGILNGVDTLNWNPQTDKFIKAPFSSSCLENKTLCKEDLQKEFNLPLDKSKAIIGLVTRLAKQKGIEELALPGKGSLYDICTKLNCQVIILGSGEEWCENELRSLASRLPNLRIFIGYNERLSHLIEAGADFFLMPSLYEPCGLNQIYSLSYGTLPIVHSTGGLADTVEHLKSLEDINKATGFTLTDLSPKSIYNTVQYALDIYYDNPSVYRKMQKNAMKCSFPWEESAKEYERVYRQVVKE